MIGYHAFARRAREIAGGMGMAAVYDGVGKTTFLEGFDALAPPTGKMILDGAASGRPDPLDMSVLQDRGSLYVQRPMLGVYIQYAPSCFASGPPPCSS